MMYMSVNVICRWGMPLAGLCLALVTQVSRAQMGTVVGTVHDAMGQPLPHISVVLESTPLGTATDLNGHYRIPHVPAGTYIIRASAVGFQSQQQAITVVAGEEVKMDFVLHVQTLWGDETLVTATRRTQRFIEVPASISLVMPREIETRNMLSLDEVLRHVSGIKMADNQVSVRGSSGFSFNTGSRVLLLLDGMPLLTPDREGIPHDALPMSQIARIEVVKGPSSVLYGSGALGGVINIITKDYPETPQTTLRLFGGAYEPVRYKLWREQWDGADNPRRFGGGSFSHARRLGSKHGFWLSIACHEDQGFTNSSKARDLDMFFKVQWRPKSTARFDLLGGWTWRKSDNFLYWNGAHDTLNPGELIFGGVEASGTSDNQTNHFSLMPSFTHVVSESFFYSVKARAIGVVIQPLEDDGTPKPVAEGTAGVRYGGELQANWMMRQGQDLTAGVTTEQLLIESNFFQPDTAATAVRSQPERAAFLQIEQTLLGRVRLMAGLRYDTYRIDEINIVRKLSPKLNVSFRMAEGFTVRATYGQGFRVPSVSERFVNNQSYLPIVSNFDLRPELSTSYELGFRGQMSVAQRIAVQTDLALFWNDYRRLVEPKFIAHEQSFQFVNLTKARIRGLEANFDAANTEKGWLVSGSYTFLGAEDLIDRTPLVLRSRHLFKAGFTIPIFGPLSLGIDYRFASAPERVDSDFSRFVRDANLVGPRKVVDARLMARWQRFSLTLLIDNAGEYYYVERPAILASPRHFTLKMQAHL